MRKQARSAAVITAVLLAAGTSLAAGVAAAQTDDSDRPTYAEARADYWEARAAYDARKAATAARKEAGIPRPTEGEEPRVEDVAEEVALEDRGPAPVAEGVPTNGQLAALRMCESNDNYGINTGNGYYGAYQFSPVTWRWLGYTGYPHQASPAVQDEAARALYAVSGWSPWPACSRYLGFA